MNKKQKIALWSCIVAIVLIMMFPPWKFVFFQHDIKDRVAGYSFFLLPPPVPDTDGTGIYLTRITDAWDADIDYSRLVIPIVIVLVICGGLMVSLCSESKEEHRIKGSSTSA